jgi:TetR/AcrR family transcriptional repressor of nem operon
MKSDLREKLIYAMFEAIYTKGYHASNLNEILKNAGISKGGLYHHFNSKKELTIAAIHEVLGDAMNMLWEKPLDVKADYLEAIIGCIRAFKYVSEDENSPINVEYGCPLNNMVQELSFIDEDFATALQEVHQQWHGLLEQALEKAKQIGECASSLDTDATALFIIASIEGAISAAKLFKDIRYYEQATAVLIQYIQTLKA